MFDQLKTPFRYLAIEPSDDFYKLFQKLCPYTEVKQCDAAHLPLPDDSVQNIICAQCFHWFDNKESLDEMFRVLVPGGRMLCIWILNDVDVDWVKETECVLKEYFEASGAPFACARKWKAVLETYNGLGFLEHSCQGGVTEKSEGSKGFCIRPL